MLQALGGQLVLVCRLVLVHLGNHGLQQNLEMDTEKRRDIFEKCKAKMYERINTDESNGLTASPGGPRLPL